MDGQAQLDGSGEVANNLFIAIRKALQLQTLELSNISLAVLNVSFICVRTYVHTLPNFATAVQSGNETTQKSNA